MDRKIILLVDDTPDNLSLLNGLLKETYKTKIATGGEKALKIAFSDNPPDLILLDIMMPEMNGFEVCRRLKAEETTQDIPVIFLSAKNEAEDEMKELGEKYDCPPLTEWGDSLSLQASMFDLDGMSKTLEKYPELIVDLQALTS